MLKQTYGPIDAVRWGLPFGVKAIFVLMLFELNDQRAWHTDRIKVVRKFIFMYII